MAVHDVHDDSYSHGVCLVDERLEFLGCAEAAAGCEEATYVVSEATIVRVFLYSHYLDAVVTELGNPGQHVVAELDVCAYLLCVLRHAYVALVYEEWRGLGLELVHLPLVFLLGVPYLYAEEVGVWILHYPVRPGRYALALSAVPMDAELEVSAMPEGLVLNLNLPVACAPYSLHGILGTFLPVVEVANHEDVDGVGCPLPEDPAVVGLVESEVQVAGCKVAERLLGIANQFALLLHGRVVPSLDGL